MYIHFFLPNNAVLMKQVGLLSMYTLDCMRIPFFLALSFCIV